MLGFLEPWDMSVLVSGKSKWAVAFEVTYGGGKVDHVGELELSFHWRPRVCSESRRVRALKISCWSSRSFPVSIRRQFRRA